MLIERSVADSFTLSDPRYVDAYDPLNNTKWITPSTTTFYVSHAYVEVMKRKTGMKVSQNYVEIAKRKSGMKIAHDYVEVLFKRGGWQIYEA